MRTWSETALRRWALLLFAVIISTDIGYVVLAQPLDNQPGLRSPYQFDASEVWSVAAPAVVGLVLTWARPRNPIGWLISTAGLLLGVADLGQTYGTRALVIPEDHLPLGTWALSFTAPLWIPALLLPATLLLVRYPTGAIAGRWPRRFERGLLIGLAMMSVGYATTLNAVTDEVPDRRPPIVLPELVGAFLMPVAAVLILGGTILIVGDAGRRALRNPGPERMSLLLLLVTAILAVLVVMFDSAQWMGSVAYSGVLVAVAVGVLRYRALGIEVVVRRTLVYSILTGLVLLVFVVVVTVLARVVPSGPTPQIVAATLIAIGLAPARERVQTLIDRVLYGERDDPFAALQRLGTPMGVSGDGDLLRDVLDALADALHVQGASIEGPGEATGDSVPLVFGGTELGRLTVTPRSGEAGLGKADLRLISAVAPLVAAVVHAVALADDLRVERARVIGATQAERRRLRQELHDGLGPSLTGIGLGLEAAQKRGATDDLLARLRTEVDASLEEVRRIIDDLRPQALDDQDLLGALRRRTEQVSSAGGVAVDLEAPTHLPDLPPSVAAAAYRIADEALTNVVRHAGATHCRVHLHVDDQLRLEVSDDGVGPGAGRDGGLGLVSMRERAERLGGRFTLQDNEPGTAVLAELPLEVS